MKRKVSIIGAGNVGATAASVIAQLGICDVVLCDIVEGMPQGKALDIKESLSLFNSSVNVTGTNSYEDIKNSDIVVITAGVARKPGMSREDLIGINSKIMTSVCESVKEYSPDSIVIVVSNPLDAMVEKAYQVLGFESNKVMGMAGILDTSRFKAFVSEKLDVSQTNVNALVLGGHGDKMVPVISGTNVGGVPLTQLLSESEINELIVRTQNGGAEIVNFLKTGSAFYAPGASIAEMIKSIILDEKKVLPVCARCSGEYGADGLYIGVPVVLCVDGISRIIELELSDKEKEMMSKTIEHVKEIIK